jgi:hypothetical protein
MPLNRPVIPAEAGIQVLFLQALDSRFHGNDTEESLFKELKITTFPIFQHSIILVGLFLSWRPIPFLE